MFSLFKKTLKTTYSVIPGSDPESRTIKLSGLDCPTCAIDLDITLEEIPGVVSAKTNYAKSECHITFDTNLISLKEIQTKITAILSS